MNHNRDGENSHRKTAIEHSIVVQRVLGAMRPVSTRIAFPVEDREGIAPMLGVDDWNEDHDDWEDRGVERFAETFVFALLDQPRRVLKVDLDCRSLLGAFRTATGADPLGPGVPTCAA